MVALACVFKGDNMVDIETLDVTVLSEGGLSTMVDMISKKGFFKQSF